MTRATYFDLFGPELVPVHMAEVERRRLQWQEAYYRCMDDPDKYAKASDVVLYRTAYESALKEAKKAFKANFRPGGQP